MRIPGNHIMVVDDNLKNLGLTGKILKDEGYLVSLIQSGKSALEQLDRISPDVILLDVMMPGMDGFEVCREIKKNENLSEIPILFLTAKDQTEDLAQGFESGGVDYITKPFRKDELLVRVKNHIDLAASRRKIIEMNKSRDKLYSIIAHDIRSPFASIAQAINSIANGYIDLNSEEFREIINYLEKKTTETITLLDNLLAFSRLQGQAGNNTAVESFILPVIDECLELLKDIADKRKILVETDIPDDQTGYFDELSVHTIFRNLLYKVILSTPEKGHIRVRSENDGEYLCIFIKFKNNGNFRESMIRLTPVSGINKDVRALNETGGGMDTLIINETIDRAGGHIDIIADGDTDITLKVCLPSGGPE